LLTEIQMTWHAHPVNEAREARGEPTINSLWLHGGGTWSPLKRGAYASVLADAPEWRGAALAASVGSEPADSVPGDASLVIWDDLLLSRLTHDWTGWVDALRGLDERAAALPHSTALDVVLAGGATARRLRSRPSDRLKFWRTRSLHQVLSE
ncbi:MAG: regulator, partial [Burkholderiaceae bacterium]